MRRATALALWALLTGCAHRAAQSAAAPTSAPPGARLDWAVAGHGRLLLELPAGWTATTSEAAPPLPASLRLTPPTGRQALILTPIWDPDAPPGVPASASSARALVELARRQAEEQSVQVPLPLLELGGGATGWWFAATDRELQSGARPAEPDEYRCLVQGVAVVGGLLLPFTLLDDGDGPHRAIALDLLRRARHQPPGTSEAAASDRPALERRLATSRLDEPP